MKYIFLAISFLISCQISAQTIYGKVVNNDSEPLIGASVYWVNINEGVSTDESGDFAIPSDGVEDKTLVVSYVGYAADTFFIGNNSVIDFTLDELGTLEEIEIQAERQGVIISNLKAIKTEEITRTELQKSACCDLAGCFESQTTVQPQTTNVITNSKELRILGLSGVYNQVLLDGFPLVQGLSYTYGISGVPGTLVENIFVAKGANSVLQGYENISGQINVITQEPNNTDKLLLNAYINSFQEKHFNGNLSFKTGGWNSLLAVHSVQPASKVDKDEDTFLDVPQLTRYMVFNKWQYSGDSPWTSSISLKFLNEQRVGGQTTFNAKNDLGSNSVYGNVVEIMQPTFSSKTAYRLNDRNNFVFFLAGFHQDQNSYFGTVKYDAKQTNFYANLQYELDYSPLHDLKAGVSFRHLDLKEDVSFTDNSLERSYAGNYSNLEQIPGFFAENTMRLFNNKLTWIAGFRGDIHNKFGFHFTPRTLLKFDLAPKTVLRANIGSGWRTSQLFSENIGLLVSSRDIIFEENLNPERAVNYGINLTQKFETDNISGYISSDFYRTDFQNQVFLDYDSDPNKVFIKNFTDESISNGFQTEIYVELWDRFELKTGYNFLDVYRKIDGEKELLPFNARHKTLTAFGYKPLSKAFHFDTNIHFFGKKRLPNTQSNPIEFQRPDFSDPFMIMNAQFTYSLKQFEVYAGCENILDFRQERAILSWENPFGRNFDTSSVWGPTRGREFYIGVRYKVE